MKRPGVVSVVALALLISFLTAGGLVAQNDQEEPAFVPGQIIIRFQPDVTREQISDFYAQYGLAEKENLDSDPTDTDEEMRLASVPVDVNESLIEILENDPRVRYAEPNYLLQISDAPNDPLFERLWGLHNTGQTGGTPDADIDALEAWDTNTGSKDVIVAVIDTGIDYNHEDLAKNIWVNPKECPQGYGKCKADGKDDDNNGYVDDFYGINVIDNTGDPMDDFGHGTHVAGTIGAVGDNGIGVTGINWNVRIVGCKFLSAFGTGTTSGAIECFNYINALKNKQKQNILVTNNSWGGGSPSQALKEAMSGPDQPLHICAAGNGNTSRPSYPAGYDLENIISVAATDHDDKYASFSNYGKPWVDLAAPGVDILSTVPTGRCALCDPSGYRAASGTSMATPHVAGSAALIWAEFKDLNNEQVKQRILSGVDMLKDRSKETLTNGRLNLLNVLERDNTPPAPVSDLAPAGVLLTKVLLNWTATGDDGFEGMATAYDLRYSAAPISEANWETAIQVTGEPEPQAPGSRESFMVEGLSPDTTYYFALRVADNVGNLSDISNVVIARTSKGSIVFEDDMEAGPDNWTVADKDALWHLSSLRFNSPGTSWYYGDEKKRNYDTGKANSGTLTSKEISVAGADDALLIFYEWSELQSSSRFDRTRVQISTDGKSWETVFESHGTNDAWVRRTVNLEPFIERTGTIQVRFWFDTINERFNEFEGWYIDDVQVLTAKLTLPGREKPLPNLVAQSVNIGFQPPAPVEGAPLLVNATILNNGAADARNISVQFMDVSGDTPLPVGPPQTIAEIPAGGSGLAQVEYDTAGKAGERKLQVIVDPNNFIPESNEADNRATRAVTVKAPPMPNLAIPSSNIGFDPAQPNFGDPVTIYATVINNGDADATNVIVQFMDATDRPARPIGQPQVLASIPAGGSGLVQITYPTAGFDKDRRIQVEVDPNNFIPESKETDNKTTKSLQFAAGDAPNLVISSANIGLVPANPVEGDAVTIYATVLNNGATDPGEFTVQFLDATTSPAVPIGPQQPIPGIPPGGSAVVQVQYETAGRAGDRKIEVAVDPHNFILESRESDNSARVTLSVTPAPAPNLVALPANMGFRPAAPREGDVVVIQATILNRGSAEAREVAVQFMDGNGEGARPIGEQQIIDAIPPGGSGIAQIEYDTTDKAGHRTIHVLVDPGNFIAEQDESDNEAAQPLTIEPAPTPNLVIRSQNITFQPPNPASGAEVTVRAVVLNNGSAPAADVTVQFMDVSGGEARPIGEQQTIDAIPVGGSGVAQVTYRLTGQDRNRKVQVLVDGNNQIEEISERDNQATRILVIDPAPRPNLTVLADAIGFSPTAPREGESILVTGVVLNTGDRAVQDVAVQFEDVTQGRPVPIGPAQFIDAIPPGGSASVQANFTPDGPPGTYKVRIVADPGNFIEESDEIDNKATRSVVVRAAPTPNLVMQADNIGFDPPNPGAGDAVRLIATVLNNGDGDAQDVLVQFVDATGGGQTPIGAKQLIDSIPAGSSAMVQVVYDTGDESRGPRIGERRIKVLVDPHATVTESDETDNTASRILRVGQAAQPNLTIPEANVGFTPPRPDEGDQVTIQVTVRNAGNADAEQVVVQFVDATDKDAPIPIGTNQLIDLIPAGSSATAQVVYDTTDRAGDRTVKITVDPNNLVSEADETDNAVQAKLAVEPAPRPNLTVKSDNVGFEPATPNPGDQVIIRATILNTGSADAKEVAVQFVEGGVNGAPIGAPQMIDVIPAGSSALAQVSYDTAGRTEDQRIQVVVDPNNFIPETKETDNSASKTLKLTTTPIANLVVDADNIGFQPAEPQAGEEVTVRVAVLNDGEVDAEQVVVQFLDATDRPETPIGEPQTIERIPAGGSATAQIVYDTTGKAGERRIKVVADPSNFIPERSESDNDDRKTLEIAAGPTANLVMQQRNVLFSPQAPTEGERVLVSAVVLNDGAQDAADVTVQFLDVTTPDATPIGQPQVLPLVPAGGSSVAQVSYDTTGKAGNRKIQVVADPAHFIPESNENDNKVLITLAVAPAPAPNLAVLAGNIKFNPPEPEVGDTVIIDVAILNDGDAPANDVLVQVLDVTDGGATPVGTEQIIDVIPPGESRNIQVVYDNTEEPGSRQIRAVADPTNAIEESNERDNRAVKTLRVRPPAIPDLAVDESALSFDPSSPTEGDKVTVKATVSNQGIADAENVAVRFQDVTGSVPQPIGDVQTIAKVPAGGDAEVEVTYATEGKAGDRRIRVEVDPNDDIRELDEENNQATRTLTVRSKSEAPPEGPNLVVLRGNISFDPASPSAGDTVTITVDVLNEGTQSARNVVVRFEDATADTPELIGDVTITGTIAAGDKGQAVILFDTTDKEGVRTIQVTADPDNEIPETNEDDNQASRDLTVGPPASAETSSAEPVVFAQPNLVVPVDQLALDISLRAQQQVVTVAATVANAGEADAGGFTVQVVGVTAQGATPLGEPVTVDQLVAGGQHTVRATYETSPLEGPHAIQVVVDPDNRVQESNEEDNAVNAALLGRP